jgi:hypothetical protein
MDRTLDSRGADYDWYNDVDTRNLFEFQVTRERELAEGVGGQPLLNLISSSHDINLKNIE